MRESTAPPIIQLGTTWRQVVSWTPQFTSGERTAVPTEQETRLAPAAGLEAAAKNKIPALVENRIVMLTRSSLPVTGTSTEGTYEGWNFNSGNYLFTTDTK